MISLVRSARTGCLIVLIAALGAGAPAQEAQDDPNVPDGLEVQTRGPIHEAYAQPNDLKPGPGQLVAKEPPPPVPEEAPEVRPEGKNIEWIPGYWAWDPERDDFLWVSGTYRDRPEGRQWMPGHWVQSDGGWRWVPGFWASAQQDEVPYVPEPPEPLNNEPNLPAPDDDSTWLPGYWHYNQSQFVWRPGYWAPQYVGRVWVTPRYIWSPSGYLFCDGYWDYPYEDRGLLFAPVWFHQPLWRTAGWFYRPWYTVGFGSFYDHCFYRPGSFHFFFGNFYDNHCWGFGYRPWFHGHRWDSCFAYHHWRHHRGDHDWHARQRRDFDDRRAGRGDRPPRTLAEQRDRLRNKNLASVKNSQVVAPVTQVKNINKNVNLVKNTPAQRDAIKKQVTRNQELVRLRNQVDSNKNAASRRLDGTRVDGAPNNGVRVGENRSLKLPASLRDADGPRSKDAVVNRSGDAKKEFRNLDGDRGKGPGGTNAGALNRPSGDGLKKGQAPAIVNQSPNRPLNVTRPKDLDGPGPKLGGQPKFEGRPRDDGPNIPKIRGNDGPGPRVLDTPRPTPSPRVIEGPRGKDLDGPGPRIINNTPPGVERRVQSPSYVPRVEPRVERRIESPAPRFNAPPVTPRFNTPPSTPRFNAPSSAPRFNPAPRSAPSRSFNSSPGNSSRSFSAAPRGSSGRSFTSAPRSSPSRSAGPARSSSPSRGRR